MNDIKISSGIGWSFIERISAQLVSFIVSIVLARLLAPESYGILAIVNVFVAIGDALVSSGFGIALVQKKDSDDTDFNSIFWVSLVISILLYVLLFISAPLIGGFYEDNELTLIVRVLGLRMVFSAINSIQQAYIQKELLFIRSCVIGTIGTIISGVIGISLALLNAGVWALIAQNLSLVISSILLLYFCLNWKPKLQCSISSIREMWSYGCQIFMATFIDALKDNIRTLVVGKVFSSADLAFYNQGMRFPQLIVNDIVNSVGRVLLPVFSIQQDNMKQNVNLMRLSIRISSFVLLPLIFGMVGIADNFVLLFLTEKWMGCVPYLRILSLVYATRSINTIMKNALLSIGRSRANLIHEFITSFLTVALIGVAVVCFHSIYLIAWSYVLVSLLGTLIFSYFTVKSFSYKVTEIFRDYLPSFALAIIMCAVVYYVGKIDFTTIVVMLVQILFGAATYLLGAWMLRLEEFFYLATYIKKRFK